MTAISLLTTQQKTLVKNHERIIYQCVLSGELEIDGMGRIWRVAKRGWGRWKQATVTRKCKRVRGERDVGRYLIVRALIDGKRYHTNASRLVWHHFSGPLPHGLIINHKNGNGKDNRPCNLELSTFSENAKHAIKVLGRNQRVLHQGGSKNHSAKLSDDDVCLIRKLYKRHVSGSDHESLANRFHVSRSTISDITRNKTWAHI